MNYNALMRAHAHAALCINTVNSNGTSWLCSTGHECNNGDDYRVLVQGRCYEDSTTLHYLFDEYDVLQVDVNGVTVY